MFSKLSRSVLVGGWLVMMAVILAVTMTMGAKLSTTAMLLALGVAVALVPVLIVGSAPSPSVAEILRSTETKNTR